tara:strand:+ start:5966 stop:6970 length:1005 start_codon:yes stop_codon:yes gene_type:complete
LKKTSLKRYNSFGVDVKAINLIPIESEIEIINFLEKKKNEKLLILGGGTNILFTKDIEYPILKIEIKGIEIINEDEDEVLVSVGAGENWNDLVWWSIENNFGGIENLVSIPGNVGSAPIQNIGAYGKEIKEVIENCRGVFIENSTIKIFNKQECKFSYRSSVFKEELKNKFIISNVTIRLSKKNHIINTDYSSLKNALIESGLANPSIKNIAECVHTIRCNKLPNYKKIGNAGSFFKNPIIKKNKLKEIKSSYPEIINHKIKGSEYKISAAWLIDNSGFKKIKENNVTVYKNQALVIINNGNATGIDIYNFSQKIKKTVRKKFDILLEEEVNIL